MYYIGILNKSNSTGLLLKKLLYIFAFCFSIYAYTLNSQPITWQRIYDGPSHVDDEAWDICESIDGNYYVAASTGLSGRRGYILKTNIYGDTIWTKRFFYGNPHSITATTDGGCVFSGIGGLFKLNSNGDSIWSKTYTNNAQIWDLKRTNDGGYIGCGRINFDSGYVFKTDLNGNLLWQKTYSAPYVIRYYSIEEGIDNGFVVSGVSYTNLFDSLRAIVTKIDNNGNRIWEKRYSINGSVATSYCIKKLNNSYIIAGQTIGSEEAKCYMAKLDISGNIYFSNLLPSATKDEFNDMAILNSSKIVFSSQILQGSLYLYSKAIISDTSGNILYQRDFPSQDWTYLKKIHITTTEHILISGTADFISGSSGNDDIYIVKMDSILNQPPFIGINYTSGIIPKDYYLKQNHPNPFNPNTTIQFGLDKFIEMVEVKIYDVLGNELKTFTKINLFPGEYSINFEGSNHSSGIYFYTLFFNNELITTKKMMLIK